MTHLLTDTVAPAVSLSCKCSDQAKDALRIGTKTGLNRLPVLEARRCKHASDAGPIFPTICCCRSTKILLSQSTCVIPAPNRTSDVRGQRGNSIQAVERSQGRRSGVRSNPHSSLHPPPFFARLELRRIRRGDPH